MADDTICPTCGEDYAPFRWCPNDHRGMVDKGYTNEPVRLSVPRTLTADDPEPGVGSVVLDRTGTAWQRVYTDDGWTCYGWESQQPWSQVARFGPLLLIHDSGKED